MVRVPSPPTLVSAFGIFLVAAVYVAMNLFASSLSDNGLVAFVLSIGIGVQPLAAQLGTATISGVVTDTTGAAVAGASITAVNTETGFRRQTVSNPIGQYNVPSLTPGQYDLTIEFQGFKKAEQKGKGARHEVPSLSGIEPGG